VLDFAQLGLCQPIVSALTKSGYSRPTPIQQKAIPPALAGRDVLGCAQTGTGKTAAFALPILQRLMNAGGSKQPVSAAHPKARPGAGAPRALVLSPTRELATQICDSLETYGAGTGLRATAIYGGVSQVHQVRAMSRGVDIVVATPGRLMDLMEQRLIRLDAVEVLVLDEADRMLDMGFIAPIRRIAAATPAGRQTMLFSATMPREIAGLAESLLRSPERVAVDNVASAAPRIAQSVHAVSRSEKPALLVHFLKDEAARRSIVFVKTKHGADKLCRKLLQQGISAQAIHGNRNQNQRQRSLDAFRNGDAKVLVATDVAARGIDVDDVTHVFNFDLPMEPEAYVHRIGRTARAGAEGVAIAFCDPEERRLLRDIERLIGTKLTAVQGVVATVAPLASVEPVARESRDSRQTHAHPFAPRKNPAPAKPGHARGRSKGGRSPQRHGDAVGSHRASHSDQGHGGGQTAAARPGLVSGAHRRRAGNDHRPGGHGVHTAHSGGRTRG